MEVHRSAFFSFRLYVEWLQQDEEQEQAQWQQGQEGSTASLATPYAVSEMWERDQEIAFADCCGLNLMFALWYLCV